MIIGGSFWKILTYPLLFLKVMLTSIFRFKLIGYRKSISFHDAVGAVGVGRGCAFELSQETGYIPVRLPLRT